MADSAPTERASPASRSHYVTADLARAACDMVAPMAEAGLHDPRIGGSGALFLVVMDPGCTPLDACFEEAVLYERGFGDPERWDADYRAFARAKARLAWQHGLDAHHVQALSPHRLRTGDTGLWGGVCLDGIVVGASGAFAWYDELYAGTVALALRALAKEAREAEGACIVLARALSNPPSTSAP